jgi:hypothetical protein
MCMMIWHPRGAEPFERAEFLDFHRKNPHGFGAIWRAPGGKVRMKKGLLTPTESYSLYRRLLANGVETMALHWRFATSGARDYDNCHPFVVRPGLAMMHNGVLTQVRRRGQLSDTRVFVADVLRPALRREPELLDDPSALREMGRWIGPGNRLLFWQQGKPEPIIINEHHGVWWKGRYFSNTYAWTVPDELRYNLDHGRESRLYRSVMSQPDLPSLS